MSDSRTSYTLVALGDAKGTADGRFDVVIPETYDGLPVAEIGNGVFSGCSSLTSITIPDSITVIEDKAFYGCVGIQEVSFPNSLTYIGISAFENCDNLVSISIPSEVEVIERRAFSCCDKLNSVKFSENGKLEKLGQEVFYLCNNLTSIIIPDGIKYIAYETFSGCNFKEITIPFEIINCFGQYYFDNNATINIYLKDVENELTNWDQIPQFLRIFSLDGSANIYVNNLSVYDILETDIVIPGNTTDIEKNKYAFCPITSAIIQNGVTSTGTGTFWGCANLASITIPDSLVKIGDSSFGQCESLTDITIPDGVAIIEGGAFYSCDNLKSIKIPASIKEIGVSAFEECSSLKEIYYGGTKQQWNLISFGSRWDDNTGNYIIHCADGDIYK